MMDIDNVSFPKLNLPDAELRLCDDGGTARVWDPIRAKWVKLTPEEWVRQHFVSMLVNVRNYRAGMLANETAVELNGMSRRCDTVVFDRNRRPWMIVEYKAPKVSVSQKTFDQIVRYNMVLRARYLVVSNGMSHYCCEMDYAAGSYRFLPDVPQWVD